MKAILFVALLATIVLADSQFKEWKLKFNKKYASYEEEQYRYSLYKKALKTVEALNAEHDGATYGVNMFADLTEEEFKGRYTTRFLPNPERLGLVEVPLPSAPHSPLGTDWSAMGYVTPIRDQARCGSCWAFSATAAIEARLLRKNSTYTPSTLDLAEQQVVMCTPEWTPYGCDGGLMDSAWNYVKAAGGMCNERDWPYTATDGVCPTKLPCTPIAQSAPTTFSKCAQTAAGLQACLDNMPVAVALYASATKFMYYTSGLVTACATSSSPDHAVFLVADGIEGGIAYWRIKNSWGLSWGEQGYIRFEKGTNCFSMERTSQWNWVLTL